MANPLGYLPSDNFWLVANDKTLAFSSAGPGYIAQTDDSYTAWIAAGNQATKIANEDELWEVLEQQYSPALYGIDPARAKTREVRLAVEASIVESLVDVVMENPSASPDAVLSAVVTAMKGAKMEAEQ